MKRLKYLLILAAFIPVNIHAGNIAQLRCEYLRDPDGIDAASPRLDWVITSDRRGERQTAYQILVASSPEWLGKDKGDLWDSGKVLSDQTSQIAYEGQLLVSREPCYWKVRVWDQRGHPGAWSRAARWQMGLLQPSDWSAKWISARPFVPASESRLMIRQATYQAVQGSGAANVTDTLSRRVQNNQLRMVVNNDNLGVDPALNQLKQLSVNYELGGKSYTIQTAENATLAIPETLASLPCLRKDFAAPRPARRAVLYVTALGLYEIHINGQRVGNHLLAPDWTDYRARVRYQAYDVTTLLKKGENTIAAIIADGWYSGHIGNGGFQFYGTQPALLAQLEVTYDDGGTGAILTDSSWKSFASPIVSSDFMLGENYNALQEVKGWDQPGLHESGWMPVQEREAPPVLLQAQTMEPVREICELKPRKITQPVPGHWVFDLGQNMVGVVRLKVKAPAGTKVTLRHAEMLNPDGTLYTMNLRSAISVDHYTCHGQGTEVWQPRFTFHGFRFVELTGLPGEPGPDAVTGIVISSDTPPAGQFTCSDPRLNQLQSNIQWGRRGNYLSIPTDCPQRDERLGWMGDAQVFVRTATYNADVAAFFTKWLVDVDDGQTASGSFSDVSPNTGGSGGVPAWGDAGVICPWTIYDVYGDRRLLQSNLPAMIKWVEYLRRHSDHLLRERDRGNDYGDWLSIQADTPKDLLGTAYFAYSTRLVAQSCAAVGRSEDAAKYEQLFQDIKAAFIKRYVAADGRLQGQTQCAYVLALRFDLLPEELRPKAAQYLEDDIKARGWHLSTGFVGVSYLLPVLRQSGKDEAVSRLLLQDTFPSWLFPVKHGATTIWERWDGWTPDKGFQDPGMNSFNHYSLGSVGEFLFGDIGGIRPASPGFKTILIDPFLCAGLSWAKTSYQSIHGQIATSWKRQGSRVTLEVTVPANTTATICVPSRDAAQVTESGRPAAKANGVRFVRQDPGQSVFEVESGTYSFVSEI
jgi:alpha-L-rhamnosidase